MAESESRPLKPTGRRHQQKKGFFHPNIYKVSRTIVEHTGFSIFTAVLTFYALFGDDFRIRFTEKPADYYFDAMCILCTLVFSLEIILSVFGKDDYAFSFFFTLDTLATVTLVLDLTFVSALMVPDGEAQGGAGASQDTSAVQLGARLSRVARVLRLLRIIKIYKTYLELRALQRRKEEMARRMQEEDNDDVNDMEVEEAEMLQGAQAGKESRVGKKLSELTTRRVIVIVMVLMFGVPLLRNEQPLFALSAEYGADVVNHAFNEYLQSPNSSTNKKAYEHAMLQYIYHHNFYTAQLEKCPQERDCSKDFYWHVFWVGIVSNNEATLADKVQKAQIDMAAVEEWEAKTAEKLANSELTPSYVYGHMPSLVQKVIGQSWSNSCDGDSFVRRGFSLIGEELKEGPWEMTYPIACPDLLRVTEKRKFQPRLGLTEEKSNEWHLAFYFDQRKFNAYEADMNILTIILVTFVLIIAAVMFTSDANRLVLYPVEKMIGKVEIIQANPLAAMKVAEMEFKVEEMKKNKAARAQQGTKLQRATKKVSELTACSAANQDKEIMETVILEKTIIKLGSLLALGFGEAGANVIEQNMRGIDSAGVNAMVEGTRVECVIGAARIRDFSTATEVLQAKVMTFVNQIAEIVHGVVNEFHGAANKNNGDTFLMIWRVQNGEQNVAKVADMSMLAFTRILGAIHRSPVLAEYRGHPGLQQRLGKNCRVNLSSGLHYGWAIEGAVGSEYKIDASYLSPNVSIAESVERATQIYGVSILVAESVVAICSPAVAAKCRLIDRVIITGSASPMDLYVVDLDLLSLTVEQPFSLQRWTNRDRFRVRQWLESEKENKLTEETNMVNFFNENADIASMRFRYTLEFVHVFNMGFQNYSQGEWQVAQRMLLRTKDMLGVEDGPSVALLSFMETPHNFEAPENWQGVRDLGHV